MSPRRATRVEFVRWLAAALHFGRSLLDRAEAEGRELRVDWSLEALNDPEPFTARLVLMPKAVSPGEDARR